MIKIKEGPKEMINKTFRLPLELVESLQAIAQNKRLSLNALVRQCLEYSVQNIDKK